MAQLIRLRPGPLHFADPVPEHRKAENGGDLHPSPEGYPLAWWPISPFNPTPWTFYDESPIPAVPAEFVEAYGPAPNWRDYGSALSPEYRGARDKWLQDLEHFKRAGSPPWATAQQLEQVAAIFERWGMGAPIYVEGRYGWVARFPSGPVAGFEAAALTVVETPHLVVANYQAAQLERGELPGEKHPFTPPSLWPDPSDETPAPEGEGE